MAVALYARVSKAKRARKNLAIPSLTSYGKCATGARRRVIESGAPATDDTRPVFQQMISNATQGYALL